jgi:hypothetical protein
MKVISKLHGVINEVSDYRFEQLIKTGEYEKYEDVIDSEEPVETPKRKRRTKAEIEADEGK